MEIEVQWRGAQPARVGALYQDRSGAVFFDNPTRWPRDTAPAASMASQPDITRRDLIRLAAEHDIGNAAATIGRVIDSVGRWMDHAAARGIHCSTAAMTAAQHRLSI